MIIKLTYYLDIVSSWCYYVEPLWQELKNEYEGIVSFDWKIALIPAEGLPKSKEEEEWYYRRSGMITKQPHMLNADWVKPGATDYLAPNLVAWAAKKMGEDGDRVRLAITDAALLDGKSISDIKTCIDVATSSCPLDAQTLETIAKDPETEAAIRSTSAEFNTFGITQRPGFHLKSEIDDRAIFSGLIHKEPFFAAIDSMIDDAMAYRSWNSHMGESWEKRHRL